MKNQAISIERLGELALQTGIDLVGVCDLARLKEEVPRLAAWQEKGHAGEMKYMLRSPEILTGTEHILKNTRSVLSCSISYSTQRHSELPPGHGRVARYAWGKDYHLVLPGLLRSLVEKVEKELGRTISFRIFTDALPFLERAGARSAGLGFIGKNTMLIRKGLGSLFFLGEIFWDLDIEPAPSEPPSNGCGSCTRCLDSCPTNAFTAPYVLNAPRCISYLTIEKRGIHTEEERRSIGEWIFGCDICQDVCPFNHGTLKHPSLAQVSEFQSVNGAGQTLDLASVLRIKSNCEFETRFDGTPLLRPGKVGLQRNALAVAVNTCSFYLENDIFEIAENSNAEILRTTALWALDEFERFGELRDKNRLQKAAIRP